MNVRIFFCMLPVLSALFYLAVSEEEQVEGTPKPELRSWIQCLADEASHLLPQIVSILQAALALIQSFLSVLAVHFIYIGSTTVYDFPFGYKNFLDYDVALRDEDLSELLRLTGSYPRALFPLGMYEKYQCTVYLRDRGRVAAALWEPNVSKLSRKAVRQLFLFMCLVLAHWTEMMRRSVFTVNHFTFAIAMVIITPPCLNIYETTLGKIFGNDPRNVGSYQMIYEADCKRGTSLRNIFKWTIHRQLAALTGLLVILLPAVLSRWMIFWVSKAFKVGVASGSVTSSSTNTAPTTLDLTESRSSASLLSGGVMLSAENVRANLRGFEPFNREALLSLGLMIFIWWSSDLLYLIEFHKLFTEHAMSLMWFLISVCFAISTSCILAFGNLITFNGRVEDDVLKLLSLDLCFAICCYASNLVEGFQYWAGNSSLSEAGAVSCAIWIALRYSSRPL